MGVPYISTTYELYPEVYGNRGAIAPLWSIRRDSQADEPIPEAFVSWTLRALTDAEYRQNLVRNNLQVCRRHFSLDALARQLRDIFETPPR